MGLPRYPDFKHAPKRWLNDMVMIDKIVRRFEQVEQALLVQGASLSMMAKVLGGGGSRSSSADGDE